MGLFHCTTTPWGARGNGTPPSHSNAVGEQWAVALMLWYATLLGSSGKWGSCTILPHCQEAAGNGTPSVDRSIVGE